MPAAALVMGLAIIIAACSPGASTGSGGLSAASAGLCDALSALPDVTLAERAFTNRAHDPLHALAGEPRLDRSLAADLLEAKQRVEDDIEQSADAQTLGNDLRSLHEAADAALAALGEDVPACDS